MLFQDRPIEKPEDLYDREVEYETLRKAVNSRTICVIVGARRIGKTSLVKATTHDLPRVYIDVRKFESFTYMSYNMFLEELKKSLNDFISWDKRILKYLRRIRSLRIHEVEVEFSLGKERPSFSSILEALEDWAEDEGKRIVMIIDEAQEFIRMKGYNILPIIAYAYDNLKHISFVFAGSKIGLLYRFLRVNDPASPLYGRYIERIELTPLNREQSLEFLEIGFQEYHMRPDKDLLKEVIDKLDGIIGWLSYLGLKAVKEGLSKEVIDKVLEDASRIAIQEFCNFVKVMNSKRYVEILKILKEGATWSEIKRYLELRLGTRMYDSELSRLLKNLIDNGFIEKKDNMYMIIDPILKYASEKIQCY